MSSVAVLLPVLRSMVSSMTLQDSTSSKMSPRFVNINTPVQPLLVSENYEWMNEKKIYIARLKAYKCMFNLPRLAEN